MFVSQTRLLRTAQRNQNGTITQFDPPQQVGRFSGIVRDIANAFAALPANQRPDTEQAGGYTLVYDARYVAVTTIAGTHSDAPNLLVVFYDVWSDDAARAATPANPPYRNTHTIGVNPSLSANALRSTALAIMEETIVRHSIEGRLGDQRDRLLIATQSDPAGVLNKAQPLNNTVTMVDRTDTTATLYPNPED